MYHNIEVTDAAPNPLMLSRPTILIVDDYLDALDVWKLYLSSAGFSVLTASDGSAAIDVANQKQPDLIVLDLDLPGKTGIEVATILRAQASTRDIPLIAATGHSHATQLELARASGFDAVMVKPCDPNEMVREIRRLLPNPSGSDPTIDGNSVAKDR